MHDSPRGPYCRPKGPESTRRIRAELFRPRGTAVARESAMMNRWLVLTAAAIAALEISGTRAGAEEPGYDPVLAKLGAPLFVRHCAACHGREGRGYGSVREALVKQPAALTAIAGRARGGLRA